MVELTDKQIREFMELSVSVMKSSIQEKRPDEKPRPFVGAVMVRQDLSYVTAYRGELREGDHAELYWKGNVARRRLLNLWRKPSWAITIRLKA